MRYRKTKMSAGKLERSSHHTVSWKQEKAVNSIHVIV